MAEIILQENTTAPATPSSGTVSLYPKSDGLMYSKDDTGTERLLSSSGLTHGQILKRVSLRA